MGVLMPAVLLNLMFVVMVVSLILSEMITQIQILYFLVVLPFLILVVFNSFLRVVVTFMSNQGLLIYLLYLILLKFVLMLKIFMWKQREVLLYFLLMLLATPLLILILLVIF